MPPPAEGFASRFFVGTALRTQPDRRLVTLVREGYETAFEEIVRRYGRPLGRYAASIVGGRSEDVLQDALAKALPALRRDDAEIDLRPWLFRIVRNTALNDLRDRPPSAEALAETIAGGRNPVEELESREELADLIRRLQALPEPQRAAIVMRELEGLGHDEIAAALGLSDGGARQAIYRARQALRDGAGMLIPLPLLQAMLAGGGSGAADSAIGAGASAAGLGGTGVALKATAVTVLAVGAVGAGIVAQGHRHVEPRGGGANRAARSARSGAERVSTPLPAVAPAANVEQRAGEGTRGRARRHGGGRDEARLGRSAALAASRVDGPGPSARHGSPHREHGHGGPDGSSGHPGRHPGGHGPGGGGPRPGRHRGDPAPPGHEGRGERGGRRDGSGGTGSPKAGGHRGGGSGSARKPSHPPAPPDGEESGGSGGRDEPGDPTGETADGGSGARGGEEPQ